MTRMTGRSSPQLFRAVTGRVSPAQTNPRSREGEAEEEEEEEEDFIASGNTRGKHLTKICTTQMYTRSKRAREQTLSR